MLAASTEFRDKSLMNEIRKILPPDLESWVSSRVAEGEFFDAGDYLRTLVRRDRQAVEELEWLRAAIAEGEASGFVSADPHTVIEDVIAERHARRA